MGSQRVVDHPANHQKGGKSAGLPHHKKG